MITILLRDKKNQKNGDTSLKKNPDDKKKKS